jgi:hypothetical protein
MTTLKQLTELNEGFDYYYESLLLEDQYQTDQYVGLPVYNGSPEFKPVDPTDFISDDEPK